MSLVVLRACKFDSFLSSLSSWLGIKQLSLSLSGPLSLFWWLTGDQGIYVC
jgi:hypothetical protein